MFLQFISQVSLSLGAGEIIILSSRLRQISSTAHQNSQEAMFLQAMNSQNLDVLL